jgi:hypothetical protein
MLTKYYFYYKSEGPNFCKLRQYFRNYISSWPFQQGFHSLMKPMNAMLEQSLALNAPSSTKT